MFSKVSTGIFEETRRLFAEPQNFVRIRGANLYFRPPNCYGTPVDISLDTGEYRTEIFCFYTKKEIIHRCREIVAEIKNSYRNR